ncbi:spore germination protein GerW family protein [Nocardia sp. NPDC051832]|uniref:spore germination protein GerW family protein n=1 Tax=Nocardia sp. NPDC051832 TaxID=3155673 RepID=UPI00341B5463
MTQLPAEGATPDSVRLLEGMAEMLSARARVGAVFGEPIVCAGITVIPVARAGFGFGGGLGRESSPDKVGEGGGGGGGMDVRPLGYIEIRDGVARYRPIRDPWVDVIVPLAIGLATSRLMRAGLRLYRKR